MSIPTRTLCILLVLGIVAAVIYSTSSRATASEMDPPPIYYPAGPDYYSPDRDYQGIPGIERAAGGRLWATCYGGGTKEGPENYVMLFTSNNDGVDWSEPVLAIDPPGNVRAFDECIWHDPLGNMWLFWAQALNRSDGNIGVWAMTTSNSDSSHPTWSEPKRLCDGVMINKPTVLSSGEWLLPVSWWGHDNSVHFVSSTDNGENFSLKGTANVPVAERSGSDEPMIIERGDGSLWTLVRTEYDYGNGIGETFSYDGGYTWTDVSPSSISAPEARFNIRRLSSGNLLLVKNSPPGGGQTRSYLTAYISTDDGATWEGGLQYGGLVLDERDRTSYPDSVEGPDGKIYVTYDYNRYTDEQILLATFTESDVLAGSPNSSAARLHGLINQAGIDPYPVVYREIFPNDNSTDQPLAESGWHAYKGTGQVAPLAFLSHVNGVPTTAVPIHSNEANFELEQGYLCSDADPTGVDYLFYTEEYDIKRNGGTVLQADWLQRNTSTLDKVRLALEIGNSGNWFVSDDTVQNSANQWQAKSIAVDDTQWRQLLFVPGSMLQLGALVDQLDPGLIIGFGLYVDSLHNDSNRFDCFEISAMQMIPGDATRDGIVDEADAQRLAANWGVTGATWDMGDFNGDEAVNAADAAILAANWNSAPASEATGVPEPCVLALLVGLVLAALLRRGHSDWRGRQPTKPFQDAPEASGGCPWLRRSS